MWLARVHANAMRTLKDRQDELQNVYFFEIIIYFKIIISFQLWIWVWTVRVTWSEVFHIIENKEKGRLIPPFFLPLSSNDANCCCIWSFYFIGSKSEDKTHSGLLTDLDFRLKSFCFEWPCTLIMFISLK